MDSILKERQLTPAQEEEIELREMAPEKYEPEFDAEFEIPLRKKVAAPKKSGYRTYTREEVAELIAASNAPFERFEPMERIEYPTLPREEAERLVREHYEYLEEEKKKIQERERWVSQKTTALGPRTENTKKRSTSTRD